jgi:hypothetical protein
MRADRGACRPIAWLAAVLSAWALPAAGAGGVDVDERLVRTLALAPATALALDAAVATVRITGSARSDVRIEIVRTVPGRDDLARLPVLVDEAPDAVRVTVRQSDDGLDPRLRAAITLDVPAAARLDAVRIAEGALDLAGLTGTLTAEVTRGPITGRDLRGVIRLETGIGDIALRGARLEAAGLLRLRTFNGDIRLGFAETPADARVLALALNGTVTSTIPLTLKTAWGPRWGEATLGAGEPVVSLDVVSGDIHIEAPSPRRNQ